MPAPLIFALSSALATGFETLLFNRLTVLRTYAHAGQDSPERLNSFAALPIQLFCVLLRRPFNLGVQVALSGSGMHPAAAGGVAGALEGLVFTPIRKVSTIQLGSPFRLRAWDIFQGILHDEGWRGFWRGGPLNVLRCASAGLIYFATMTACRTHLPESGHLVQGGLSAAAATLWLQPFEVALTRLYLKREAAQSLADMARGLGLCLARNVPGGALRWWLTQALAGWMMA